MSPDPNDEYFSDGMTEELISAVSRISELSVVSQTSVMGYKGKDKRAVEIASELNVGTLIEGSVRKVANRVRITVQLIDAGSDKHLWVENYDRNLEDVFALQSEVAEKVASSLRLKFTEESKRRIERGGTWSMEAYTLYLKGRLKLDKWESLSTAINYFEQALHLDPNYTLAYCGLATAHSMLGYFDIVESREAYPKAEQYARRALELDESLADGHVALALSHWNSYDFAGMERELKRAIQLNPNLVLAHVVLAGLYAETLRWEDCPREIERALELDPLSVIASGNGGTIYLYMGEYDKAIKHLRDAVELDPNHTLYLDNLGLAYIQKGMVEEGLAMVKQASEIAGPSYYPDLAWAYVKAQRVEEARKLLRELYAEERKHTIAMAGVYAVLGEKQKAMDWLEKAYSEGSGYLATTIYDFVFETLWHEPRYQALIEKMGLKKHI